MKNLILVVACFLSSFFVVCIVGHHRDSKVRTFGLQGAGEAQWGLCHQSAGRRARGALSRYHRIHELLGTGSKGSWAWKGGSKDHWHQEVVSEMYLKGEKEMVLGIGLVAFWAMEEEALSDWCIRGQVEYEVGGHYAWKQ